MAPRSGPPGGSAPAPDGALLRTMIEERYPCCQEEVLTARGKSFSLLRVRDPSALLDAIDPATFAEDERLPYWSELWASSVCLADWCLSHPGLRGRRVLELGCGLGLAGIAAASAGAAVVLSDYDEDALLFARYNAMQNNSAAGVEVLPLDWRRPGLGRTFDIVLGADILYERRHFQPLLDAIRVLLAPGGLAVLSDPDRATGNAFFGLAAEEGYSIHRTVVELLHHERHTSINCCELRRGDGDPLEATR